MDVIRVDPEVLSRWNISVPRYTSYPTAPQFYPLEEGIYRKKIEKFDRSNKPLSIYIHIPFCKTMCLFCGCSVVLNRRPEKQTEYLELLLKEIQIFPFQSRRTVSQLHLGGGTPTSLSEEEFAILMDALTAKFHFAQDAEISIEIDPRTVFGDRGKKLKALKNLGFNRVSFGVQDLDPRVQEAVKRHQSEEMTVSTYFMARDLGFHSVNLDLIYGLPYQTVEGFAKTTDKIVEMKPDRIALFSYAKVPWLKTHQKAIKEDWLPTDEEKFLIYVDAREKFMRGGYVAIGMDHFSLASDSLAKAYQDKTLDRNFQGYALALSEDMIGLGVSSIGFLEGAFFQNMKTIDEYKMALRQGELPIHRGYILQEEDLLRRWVIQTIMCHFSLDKDEFHRRFGIPFALYFVKERKEMDRLIGEGLLEETESHLFPTPMGCLFIRLIASVFDAYLKQGQYSKAL